MNDIPPPEEPVQPEYEKLGVQPDQAHVWKLDENGKVDDWVVESGYHNGPGCQRCDYSFCEHCENGYDDLGCLRNQAEERNFKLEWAYKLAMKRYEAQMDYWRTLTGSP